MNIKVHVTTMFPGQQRRMGTRFGFIILSSNTAITITVVTKRLLLTNLENFGTCTIISANPQSRKLHYCTSIDRHCFDEGVPNAK